MQGCSEHENTVSFVASPASTANTRWQSPNQPSPPFAVKSPPSRCAPLQAALLPLIELAALFHDIGKATDAFQRMLRGTLPSGQHLRHDLMSYLMLKSIGADDAGFLSRIASDPQAVFAHLTLSPEKLALLSNTLLGQDESEEAVALLQRIEHGSDKLMPAILYLVLTHHRQIAASDLRESSAAGNSVPCRPSLRRHINQHLELSPENWQISSRVVPWLDAAWLDSVRRCAASLRRVFEDNEGLAAELAASPILWAKTIAMVARPTLIQADHLASAGKAETTSPDAECSYANTMSVGSKGSRLADSLSTHLLKTQEAVGPYFGGMEALTDKMPYWTPPAHSLLRARGTSPKEFAWQGDAAGKVAAIPDVAERPFFGVIVSGTGAGKTLGGPMVLAAAAGGELRYTCAPGLRSLTLQTGAEYQAMLGMADADLLTVVGDALYAQLSGNAGVTENEARGSESLDAKNEFVFDRTPVSRALASALGFTPAQADWLSRGKQMTMTEVPVLVCTVDHMMGASALSSGADTRMSLRLATSDIILDEIDNYSLEDLQALGRLVHQVGCHGRRVVLMSATVSETVLQALYTAWHQGLAVWQFRTGATCAPVVALVSNQVPSIILEATKADSVSLAITGFLSGICAVLEQTKSRVVSCSLQTESTLSATFRTMYQQALAFADIHNTVDPVTGKSVSMGFVRFNQVKHCRQFARYMFDTVGVPPGVGLKVQCYHRKMPIIHLTHVERLLNRLLSRKRPQAVFAHPVVTDWFEASPDCDHYVIIVATTSIQETGRDHCYDWAVTEPWSNRSIVQLAGRVLRHRTNFVPTSPNVAVLTCELSYLEANGNRALEVGREPLVDSKGQSAESQGARGFAVCTTLGHQGSLKARGVWASLAQSYPMPGEAAGVVPAGVSAKQSNPSRVGWLPPGFSTTGINARPCLQNGVVGEGYLNYLEHSAQRRRMQTGKGGGLLSLADITVGRPNAATEVLWDRHNTEIKFRRASGTMAQLTLDPASGFTRLMAVERHPTTQQLELKDRATFCPSDWRGGTVIKRVERALVPLHLFDASQVYARLGAQADESSLAARLCHSFEVHLRLNRTTGRRETGVTAQVDYDPLLGADRHSSLLLE